MNILANWMKEHGKTEMEVAKAIGILPAFRVPDQKRTDEAVTENRRGAVPAYWNLSVGICKARRLIDTRALNCLSPRGDADHTIAPGRHPNPHSPVRAFRRIGHTSRNRVLVAPANSGAAFLPGASSGGRLGQMPLQVGQNSLHLHSIRIRSGVANNHFRQVGRLKCEILSQIQVLTLTGSGGIASW